MTLYSTSIPASQSLTCFGCATLMWKYPLNMIMPHIRNNFVFFNGGGQRKAHLFYNFAILKSILNNKQ